MRKFESRRRRSRTPSTPVPADVAASLSAEHRDRDGARGIGNTGFGNGGNAAGDAAGWATYRYYDEDGDGPFRRFLRADNPEGLLPNRRIVIFLLLGSFLSTAGVQLTADDYYHGPQQQQTYMSHSFQWENRSEFPVHIAFNEVGCSVSGIPKPILSNVTGEIRPGMLTGILGASGSGKTTLAHSLLGRGKRYCSHADFGQVFLNGRLRNLEAFIDRVGFVPQDDILYPDLTVEEALTFSASWRLPRDMSEADKAQVVEDAIQTLALDEVRHRRIGDATTRSISGGERKRTSIGMELVSLPAVLIMDEPTSGLDSAGTFRLMTMLRNVALRGVSVVTVIHQPSARVFELMDDVILMQRGEAAFVGPRRAALPFLERMGFALPSGASAATPAAEFILDVLTDLELPVKHPQLLAELADGGGGGGGGGGGDEERGTDEELKVAGATGATGAAAGVASSEEGGESGESGESGEGGGSSSGNGHGSGYGDVEAVCRGYVVGDSKCVSFEDGRTHPLLPALFRLEARRRRSWDDIEASMARERRAEDVLRCAAALSDRHFDDVRARVAEGNRSAMREHVARWRSKCAALDDVALRHALDGGDDGDDGDGDGDDDGDGVGVSDERGAVAEGRSRSSSSSSSRSRSKSKSKSKSLLLSWMAVLGLEGFPFLPLPGGFGFLGGFGLPGGFGFPELGRGLGLGLQLDCEAGDSRLLCTVLGSRRGAAGGGFPALQQLPKPGLKQQVHLWFWQVMGLKWRRGLGAEVSVTVTLALVVSFVRSFNTTWNRRAVSNLFLSISIGLLGMVGAVFNDDVAPVQRASEAGMLLGAHEFAVLAESLVWGWCVCHIYSLSYFFGLWMRSGVWIIDEVPPSSSSSSSSSSSLLNSSSQSQAHSQAQSQSQAQAQSLLQSQDFSVWAWVSRLFDMSAWLRMSAYYQFAHLLHLNYLASSALGKAICSFANHDTSTSYVASMAVLIACHVFAFFTPNQHQIKTQSKVFFGRVDIGPAVELLCSLSYVRYYLEVAFLWDPSRKDKNGRDYVMRYFGYKDSNKTHCATSLFSLWTFAQAIRFVVFGFSHSNTFHSIHDTPLFLIFIFKVLSCHVVALVLMTLIQEWYFPWVSSQFAKSPHP